MDNAAVVLRGLTLNGSLGGMNGITFTGAATESDTKLHVENCVISGFANNGVNFARNGTLFISDLIAGHNSVAIYVDGSAGFRSSASIDHALIKANGNGLEVQNASVAVSDSVAAGNFNAGFWAIANDSGKIADLSVDSSQATGNTFGFYSGGSVGTARLIVSNSVASLNSSYAIFANDNGTVRATSNTVSGNYIGLAQFGTGVFRSRGNNTVDGNTNDTSGTITTFGPL